MLLFGSALDREWYILLNPIVSSSYRIHFPYRHVHGKAAPRSVSHPSVTLSERCIHICELVSEDLQKLISIVHIHSAPNSPSPRIFTLDLTAYHNYAALLGQICHPSFSSTPRHTWPAEVRSVQLKAFSSNAFTIEILRNLKRDGIPRFSASYITYSLPKLRCLMVMCA